MKTKSVVIFCPEIGGHRLNYCYVIGSWFARNGFFVKLATAHVASRPLADEKLLVLMRKLWNVELLEMEDTQRKGKEVGGYVPEILEMERRLQPTWTFFPAAEEMELALDGLGKSSPDSSPLRAAIFVHMRHIYPPAMRTDLRMFRRIYHRYYGFHKRKWACNRWYRDSVWSRLGLTMAFSPNGDFIRRYACDRFFYLPDIYRAYGSQMEVDASYIGRLCDEYGQFLRRHPGKRIILYFGGWCARRAYDELLYLALNEKDTVFVSCGRPVLGDEIFVHDVPTLRKALAKEGRIHEVEIPFLPDNAFTDMLFNSAPFVLLPYPNYVGLSGILLQATSYGKPVVVTNLGYMASLVKRHNLGLCYRNGDKDDFLRAYRALSRTAQTYTERVRLFSEGYSQSATDKYLAAAINQF